MAEIKNPALRRELKKRGHEDVHLWKDNGYFGFYCDDLENPLNSCPTTSVCVNSFYEMTPKEWVDELERMLTYAR